jgi:hypothetical protein
VSINFQIRWWNLYFEFEPRNVQSQLAAISRGNSHKDNHVTVNAPRKRIIPFHVIPIPVSRWKWLSTSSRVIKSRQQFKEFGRLLCIGVGRELKQCSQYTNWATFWRSWKCSSIPGKNIRLSPLFPDRMWGPRNPLLWRWRGGYFAKDNASGFGADHSPLLFVSKLKISGAIPSLPYTLHDVHKDNFILCCTNGGAGRNVVTVVTLKIPIPEFLT